MPHADVAAIAAQHPTHVPEPVPGEFWHAAAGGGGWRFVRRDRHKRRWRWHGGSEPAAGRDRVDALRVDHRTSTVPDRPAGTTAVIRWWPSTT
jgi:hypothetical protein